LPFLVNWLRQQIAEQVIKRVGTLPNPALFKYYFFTT
jgi:hypothetical protein